MVMSGMISEVKTPCSKFDQFRYYIQFTVVAYFGFEFRCLDIEIPVF
jgi:hypothetical protein